MTTDIYRGTTHLGTLQVDESGYTLKPISDSTLKALLDRSFREGVHRFRDVHDENRQIIVREPIKPEHPGFPLALFEWLRSQGLDVRIRHPEVDEEIRLLLAKLPDNQLIKGQVLQQLSSMNYLEKTFIIEKLKEKFGLPK